MYVHIYIYIRSECVDKIIKLNFVFCSLGVQCDREAIDWRERRAWM